jgi:hypothetical protein
MRVMARSAHLLGEGNMDILGFLHILRLHMAGVAKIAGFRDQQVLILGGVRPMAGKAPLLACNRRVHVDNLGFFVLMAIETELISALP